MVRKLPRGLPDREALLRFVEDSATPVGKREIAQAFGLQGADKIALKAMLKEMEGEGLLEKGPDRAFHAGGGLPKAGIVTVVSVAPDGTALCTLEQMRAPLPGLRIRLIEPKRSRDRIALGDRFVCRIEAVSDIFAKAHPIKKLERLAEPVLGVLRHDGDAFKVMPADKRLRFELSVRADAVGDARVGDLVLAEPGGGRAPAARITDSYGPALAPRAYSLIAIHAHGIPDRFSAEALADAARSAARPLGPREDLRDVPLLTIDPEDARDHDDAVFAQADEAGGWRIVVAIADVSFYVRPGTALDEEARVRGNSVYFPDRVVPMLPEVLSGDVCSLKQDVDRACLAAHLHIDADGKLLSWRFARAVMRSRADMTYAQAQAAMDGAADAIAAPLLESVLKPLWGAWTALGRDRSRRAPLAIDLPERQVRLDDQGRIVSIAPHARFDAHKVVEDFMILANVAAAKQLAQHKAACIARVHEPPAREKLVAFRDFLEGLGQKFSLGQVMRPDAFNRILELTRDLPEADLIQEMVLRTQTQAYYTPEALGHFGLALRSYAHFTSPIRRYADLIVHRSLVRALGLGEGGLVDDAPASLERIADHVSKTERRAMAAERDTLDRYIAAHLSQQVGSVLETRITGVTRFGLFLTVEGIGGDGLVPLGSLGDEYFEVDTTHHRIEGRSTGTSYRLGQKVQALLVDANPVTGGLRFQIVAATHEARPRSSARRSRPAAPPAAAGRRGRGTRAPRPSGRGKR